MTLREQLLEMAEPGYRDFISPLMPGVENVIGIRIPYLRKIAKQIVHGDWRTYLASAEKHYFEERMLHGLVIGYAKCDPAERLSHIEAFLPQIDNWAVCDSFCMRKLNRDERAVIWEFIQPLFTSGKEYYARFAIVTTRHSAILSTRSISTAYWNYWGWFATTAIMPVWAWRGQCRGASCTSLSKRSVGSNIHPYPTGRTISLFRKYASRIAWKQQTKVPCAPASGAKNSLGRHIF